MKKTCVRCSSPKEMNEFRIAKRYSDGHYSYCIECEKEYQKTWHQKNKQRINKKNSHNTRQRKQANQQWLWDYLLGHPCIDCKQCNPIVLQFDHVQGKKFRAIKAMLSYGLAKIKSEISKCVVRCANCHAIKTASQRGYHKNINTGLV